MSPVNIERIKSIKILLADNENTPNLLLQLDHYYLSLTLLTLRMTRIVVQYPYSVKVNGLAMC